MKAAAGLFPPLQPPPAQGDAQPAPVSPKWRERWKIGMRRTEPAPPPRSCALTQPLLLPLVSPSDQRLRRFSGAVLERRQKYVRKVFTPNLDTLRAHGEENSRGTTTLASTLPRREGASEPPAAPRRVLLLGPGRKSRTGSEPPAARPVYTGKRETGPAPLSSKAPTPRSTLRPQNVRVPSGLAKGASEQENNKRNQTFLLLEKKKKKAHSPAGSAFGRATARESLDGSKTPKFHAIKNK